MSTPPNSDETIFAGMLARPQLERAAFLDHACTADAQQRVRIEELVHAHEESERSFMATAGSGLRSREPAVGEMIGRYKLRQKLGEGGCGIVYLAAQEEPVRRSVALKVIKLGMDTREVIARFEAERQALAMMDHPNIARVFDGGSTDAGRPFFVMELVRGVPITHYCDQQNLLTVARLNLFVQVCHAVQHAHQKGIIHRDLKPTNILVTLHDGVPVPKVIDFGIAKATQGRLTESTLFTAFEQFIGTPAYMSPEQAELSGLDIDTRSDIYSLGVLLYELLSGRPPFDPKTLVQAGIDEIRRIIREVEPPRPSTRLDALDDLDRARVAKQRSILPAQLSTLLRGDLDWIVMRCLEKDRRRRYENANDLARDVERHLRNEPVTARPPSSTYRLGKTLRRHRAAFAFGTIALVALVAGLATSLTQAVRAQRAERKATAEAATSEAISNFLQHDLIGEAAAERQPDREITVRTALDRAAEKLDRAFPDQPRIEAALRNTVARTYHSLGEYTAMQKHLERALELELKWRGPDDIYTLETIASLGEACRAQGKFTEAEKYFARALQDQKRTLGAEHRETLISMNGLAMTYRGQGRFAEAAPLYEQTLALQQRLLPPKHADEMLSSMNQLGLTYRALGRLAESATLLTRALELRQRILGDDYPDTLASMHNVAHVRRLEGRLDEAAAIAERAAAAQQRVLGAWHPMALRAQSEMAAIYRAQGRLAEAAALLEDVLARQQRIAGNNPDTLVTMHELAVVQAGQRRLDEAQSLFERVLQLRRERLGAGHPDIASTLGALGRVLLERQRLAEAAPPLREAIALREKHSPADWTRFAFQSDLGAVLVAEHRYADAEPILLSAFEGMKQRDAAMGAEDKPLLREAADRLVQLYDSWKEAAKAAAWRTALAALDQV